MKFFDIVLKNNIAKVSTTFPTETVTGLAAKLQDRHDYLLQVFTAPVATQIALRNAIKADTRKFPQHVARALKVLLALDPNSNVLNPNEDGPVILPPSTPLTTGGIGVLTGPSGGKVIRYEVGNISVAATPDVSPSSPIWDYTARPYIVFSPAGSNIPVIVKAQYFSGSNPISRQSLAVYRVSSDAANALKTQFLSAFERRANNTIGALSYIAAKYYWYWHVPPPPPIPPPAPPASRKLRGWLPPAPPVRVEF